MNLRERKKIAVRARLYETSISMFRDRGYDRVSVNDIVDAAGVAKGTFFNHFETKAHVLAEWYAQELTIPALPDDLTFAETVHTFILPQMRKVEENEDLVSAKLAYEIGNPLLEDSERAADRALAALFGSIMEKDPAIGICPSRISGAELGATVVTMMTGIVREWRINRDFVGLEDLASARFGTFLTMLQRPCSDGEADTAVINR